MSSRLSFGDSIGRGCLRFALAVSLSGVISACSAELSFAVPVKQTPIARGVLISGATVTAGVRGGDSAVVLTFFNGTSQAVSLLSVRSTVANSDMVMFDDNMCQGNNVMIPMRGIYVTSGHTQLLGYKYQGAMLIGLHERVVVGGTLLLTVTWSDSRGFTHGTRVTARVVNPPKYLHFGSAMPAMSM